MAVPVPAQNKKRRLHRAPDSYGCRTVRVGCGTVSVCRTGCIFLWADCFLGRRGYYRHSGILVQIVGVPLLVMALEKHSPAAPKP